MTAKRPFVISIAIVAIMFAVALSAHGVSAQAATPTTSGLGSNTSFGLFAAAVSIVGSAAAAGYAVAKAASAAAAAIVERPGAFGPMLILAGLGEGIAIYGLLVAFQILTKIPNA